MFIVAKVNWDKARHFLLATLWIKSTLGIIKAMAFRSNKQKLHDHSHACFYES